MFVKDVEDFSGSGTDDLRFPVSPPLSAEEGPRE